MAAELIAHAISESPSGHSRSAEILLAFLRSIRHLFAVQISSQPMKCRRQRLAREFT